MEMTHKYGLFESLERDHRDLMFTLAETIRDTSKGR